MPNGHPFRSETDFRTWLLPLVGAAAIVAAFLWLLSSVGVQGDLSNVFVNTPARVDAPMAAELPTMTDVAEPAPTVRVQTCVRDGVRVYSDSACGSDAATYEIETDRLSTYTPPATDTTPVARARRGLEADYDADAPPTPDRSACDAIQREIEAIDARMRRPYLSQEGEFWRARRREAKEQYHLAGCTWHTPE